MRLLNGTSGFAYKEWKGRFYPQRMPAAAMLAYYAERFPAVEVNNSFYKMPSEDVFSRWAAEVPHDFTFAVKAPQQITHRRRLQDAAEPIARFFRIASALGHRLGPVLVQLPPTMVKDVERLETFLGLAPAGVRVAFEFRHPSWFADDVFTALRARGAALCIAHGEAVENPVVATAPWGYLRLRQVTYEDAHLAAWARNINAQPWSEAFVFFKHEDTATGPRLARRFAELFAQTQAAAST